MSFLSYDRINRKRGIKIAESKDKEMFDKFDNKENVKKISKENK